jgi:hypothetical protein
MLRISELVAVDVEHIRPNPDNHGAGSLEIPKSKTDQDGKGAVAYLSAETLRVIDAYKKSVY